MSLFDYKNFDSKTKEYINIAMSIYNAISEKSLSIRIKKFGEETDYEFTDFDKKILSLFIAGFFLKGNLKNLITEYKLADLKELLRFVDLKKEDIKSFTNDYADFYNKYFKSDLINMIKKGYDLIDFYAIKPEVIFYCFHIVDFSKSFIILDYFYDYAGIGSFYYYSEEFYKSLKSYLKANNYIPKVTIDDVWNGKLMEEGTSENKKIVPAEEDEDFELPKLNSKFIDTNRIVAELKKKFVGQEVASESLFYNIMLICKNDKNILLTVYKDFLSLLNNNKIENNIYMLLADGIDNYIKGYSTFPLISDYQ